MSINSYLTETRKELAHVNWPTRQQALIFTAIVIVFSLAVSFFLAFFDLSFTTIIGKLISPL